MASDFSHRFNHLLTLIRQRYQTDIAVGFAGRDSQAVARIKQHLAAGADLGLQREVAPLRGSKLLPQVVARAHGSTTEAMTRACADLAPSLFWKQNPNYSDKAMQRAGYMDAYGYAELIGPTGWSLRQR